MEKLISLSLVVVALFSLIQLPPSHCSTLLIEKGADLIEKTCRRTKYYNLCVSSLHADPRSVKADAKGLARIMLELSLAKANVTLVYIQQLYNMTMDPVLKPYFNSCIELYRDVAEQVLQMAISFLDSNNYKESSKNAEYASTTAQDCEDRFKGPPEVRKSPLTKENNALSQLSSVAGEILPPSQCSTLVIEKGADLIEKTCRRTKYHNLCVSSLHADPRSAKADVKGLARIILELSLAKANVTLVYIQQLYNKTTDPVLKPYFNSCIEQYRDVAEQVLQMAISFLDSNNYKESSTNAEYASTAAQDCEDRFKGPPEVRKSPLTKENNALSQLSSLAGEIVFILWPI
ncbi:unnamed protein product [Ilex paraguariensis]|uniref:Pectinesterase inhibitor domain-containing protein n=1 Tax=Ilex paraguariensis TaxID=185542 RepID=A0ABC8RRS7_9AQUA